MSVTLTANNSLSIDQWAELMGVPILEFNNLDISACQFEYDREHCSQFWSHWQYSSNATISREQLSFFIQQAEQQIENYLGYHVAPKWSLNEQHMLPKGNCVDLRNIKFRTNWKNVIHSGSPKFTEIGTADVVYSDEDGDGYNELATITFINEGLAEFATNFPNRFRIFMPGHMGQDEYEISYFLEYDYDPDNYTLTLKANSWILLNPNLYLPKSFAQKRAWNACDPSLYVSQVEIGFEEVDTCLPNAQLVWSGNNEPCLDGGCVETTKPACVRWINKCEGIFTVVPVSVNEETGCVENYLSTYCDIRNMPDSVRLNYISGCHDKDDFVHPTLIGINPCSDLVRAILTLSITYLGNEPCACTCIEDQIKYYNTDLATTSPTGTSFRYLPSMIDNVFGSAKRGAIEAFRIIENIKGKKGLCYQLW
jgi:hypothetical protein